MIMPTATSSANSAFHHNAASSPPAPPVPAMTGATAFGNVRGRAPSTHCAKLATSVIVPRGSAVVVGQSHYEVDGDRQNDRAEEERQHRVAQRSGTDVAGLDVGVRNLICHPDGERQVCEIAIRGLAFRIVTLVEVDAVLFAGVEQARVA